MSGLSASSPKSPRTANLSLIYQPFDVRISETYTEISKNITRLVRIDCQIIVRTTTLGWVPGFEWAAAGSTLITHQLI